MLQEDQEDPNDIRITKQFLKKLLRSDFKFYYTTPYLNNHLYIHYKGFSKIENLEEFTGLRVLYIEGNGIKKIEGLDQCVELRSLYMQENLIKKIQNLDKLVNLVNLNLSDCMLDRIENLKNLTSLGSLQLKRNFIGREGYKDLLGLLECPSITSLDLTDNKIEDENVHEEIIKKMPKLAVLYLVNNGVQRKIKNYRKNIIFGNPTMKYVDDRPVFDDERRFVNAFFRGGLEEERNERKKYKEEQATKHMQEHIAFRDMMNKYKREADERRAQEEQEREEEIPELEDNPDVSEEQKSESSMNTDSLPTYNTENTSSQQESSKNQTSQSSEQSQSEDEKSARKSQSENEDNANGNEESNYLDELE